MFTFILNGKLMVKSILLNNFHESYELKIILISTYLDSFLWLHILSDVVLGTYEVSQQLIFHNLLIVKEIYSERGWDNVDMNKELPHPYCFK